MTYFEIGEQDTWFCEACMKEFKINNGLEIHHIQYRSHGGTNDIQNLISIFGKKLGNYFHTASQGEYDEPVQERERIESISRIAFTVFLR